ncbi:MAG: NAD(P)/FAD-dependent oxidoreductase [Elusimicrobiota bacterium]
MEKIKTAIIGAGVVGLAVASELGGADGTVFVIEKKETFGTETSSRNSEVIHAGIYYPKNSLKHLLCIEGNRLLYEICEKTGIGHKRTGKLIVAPTAGECEDLNILYENGRENEVPGLKIISGAEAREYEPSVRCEEAVFSETTGIIDTHALMKYFAGSASGKGVEIIYHTDVVSIEKDAGGYRVTVKENDGSEFSFISETVINSAGLDSDIVAEMAGINPDEAGYRLHYCKGSYFRLKNPARFGISHLVYPAVKKGSKSLGIHIALDLSGGIRLGPDAEYVLGRTRDFSINEEDRSKFHESVSNFIPEIDIEDLYPDTAGIRPKRQGPDDGFRDFIITDESEKGCPGFIDLIGIESPGLTAAPAIAEAVKKLIKDL